MVKNLSPFLRALFSTIVVFASIHLIVLFIKAGVGLDPTFINIFRILEVEEFVPSFLVVSPVGNIISAIFIAGVFITFYFLNRKSE